VPRFLRNMNKIDGTPQNLQANFHSAIASGVYSPAGHATRLDTRLNGALAATGDQLPSSVMQPGGQQNPNPPGAAGSMRDLIDPLKLDRLYNQARILSHREDTEARIGFSNSLTDDYTEAGHTGIVTTPKTLDDFRNAGFDEEEAQQRFDQYRATTQMYADRLKMAGMNPSERQDLIASYAPHPGGPPGTYHSQQLRQDELSKVDTAINEATAATDKRERQKALAAFQARVTDSSTEAARAGSVATGIPRSDFIDNLGEDKGPEAWRTYTRALQFGADAASMHSMTAEDRAGMVATWSPQPGEEGYAEKARFQDEIIKVNKSIDDAHMAEERRRDALADMNDKLVKERDADPAGYTVKYAPAVGDAFGKLQDAMAPGQSAIDPARTARDYALATQMEQQRLGVAPDAMTIVPKSYVEGFTKAVTAAADNDDPTKRIGLIGQIQKEAAMWGDNWSAVMRQMAPGAQPVVRAIAAGADPVAMTRLLSLPKEENRDPAKILKEQNDTTFKDLTKNLNDAFAPFRGSLIGRQMDRDYPGYYGLAEKLGALYVRDGKSASDAAGDAFKALIGNRYDFRDTWRMPKSAGVTADDVQAGTEAARLAIAQASTGAGQQIPTSFEQAKADLKLTPQEQNLYQRHLTNLTGPGGVDNPDGSRSSLLQTTVESDGKTYNIPTVWDGKTHTGDEAWQHAKQEGLDKFPSYASEDEAEARYGRMHDYMEQDTGRFLQARKANPVWNIAPAVNDIGLSDNRLDSLKKFARDGRFVTSHDNAGLNLVYDDNFVRTTEGKPLFFSWADLAQRGGTPAARQQALDRAALSGVQP
jgi:hypothetical protein